MRCSFLSLGSSNVVGKIRQSHRVNDSESHERESRMRKLPTFDVSRDRYYAVLGIPETATQDEIKRAYRRLIKQIHPDKFSNTSPNRKLATEKKSKEVIEAYYVLSDSVLRSSYDQQMARYRQQHTPPLPRPEPRTATASTPARKAGTAPPPRSCTSRPSPRSQPQADQKRSHWAFLGRVLLFGMYCRSLLIVAAILVSLFIDILMSLVELLQPS